VELAVFRADPDTALKCGEAKVNVSKNDFEVNAPPVIALIAAPASMVCKIKSSLPLRVRGFPEQEEHVVAVIAAFPPTSKPGVPE